MYILYDSNIALPLLSLTFQTGQYVDITYVYKLRMGNIKGCFWTKNNNFSSAIQCYNIINPHGQTYKWSFKVHIQNYVFFKQKCGGVF